MQVFHGSTNLFDKFSYSRIGTNGTTEGIGFYFTDNEDIAIHYAHESGYIYEVDFTGVKPLSDQMKTITKPQLTRFIRVIGELYLNNYGDIHLDGFNNLLRQAVNDLWESNDSDVDIICSILNGIQNYQYILELLNDLLGYDSVNASWENGARIYVALVHKAYNIKNVYRVTEFIKS